MHSSTNATPPTTTVEEGGASATFSALHPDIIGAHILTRLDGPSLAFLSCASTQLHSISSQQNLWSHLCDDTWPSVKSPRMRHIISTFPKGAQSFFADSFPVPISDPPETVSWNEDRSSAQQLPTELISAVDIYFKEELIYSKVQEMETVSGWFQCSPFRVDFVDAKDVVPTPIKQDNHHDDDTCTALAESLTLSWIMVDPINRRAMNLSSHRPVTVQRHWLSGEVQARFAWILAGDQTGSASESVQCEIVVTTCNGGGGTEEGDTMTTTMQVREISMVMEDMDGIQLRGKESMVILQRAMEGKRGIGEGREMEGERRYMEYLERKRERREKKLRTEGRLDSLCMAFGVSIFAALGFFFFF